MRAMILVAVAFLATPLHARDLPVPSDKGWQHAETGLILPATLDGLARTKLIDTTDSEHDVAADFDNQDHSVEATVYIFHPAIDDVAMWFERAQTQIENRKEYGGVAPMSADPVAFAPPRGSPASALRRSYTPEKGAIRSTALAVMPLGTWLVVVRMSSEADRSAALERRLDAVITAIRWPSLKPSPPVRPIPACTDALRFDKAKVVKPDGSTTLLTLVMGAVASDPTIKKTDLKPVSWCRDAATRPAYGIYRDADGGLGYEMALQDAGRVVHVTPTLDTMTGKGHGFAISLTGVDGTTDAFPSFDRLPEPDQVVALIGHGRSASSTTKDGKTNITLPADFK